MSVLFFFFNDTATTEIYTLSLHDALPILQGPGGIGETFRQRYPFDMPGAGGALEIADHRVEDQPGMLDRKSTRLNSSHANISYAVFCLKKKTTITKCIKLHIYITND